MVVSPSLVTEEVISTRHVRIKASKDDAFFDSKPWLDSELEDEFFSVNGGKAQVFFILGEMPSSIGHEIENGYEVINSAGFCISDSFYDILSRYIGADVTPLRDNDEATIPHGSPAPATESGKRKKLGEHFRESIIWEGRASVDEDNSQVKPRTHVLVYPNKSHLGSTKRPTSVHWKFKEEGSKSGRSSRLIRRCIERFALCRPSRGDGKKVCSSIVET